MSVNTMDTQYKIENHYQISLTSWNIYSKGPCTRFEVEHMSTFSSALDPPPQGFLLLGFLHTVGLVT